MSATVNPRPVTITGRASLTRRETRATGHPDWCARGHHCGLGEHRSEPLRVDLAGIGTLIVTRVRSTTGHQYAEVRASLRLTPFEPHARQQLTTLLDGLTRLLWTARRAA